MRKQAFSVHGHFYQPPRENPFTGKIPQEPGATPFNNWNEKILAQCYRPNAEDGNFGRISFDLGPTLATWMDENAPDVMEKIVQQERSFYETNGVGNGMALSYNHTILPLATLDDKITQIKWGIADFEARFGHQPLGLWAPETAIDLETLMIMEQCGICYTILAPWQANTRVGLDTSRPYWVDLPHEKRIAVFFYEEQTSMRVSFDPEATVNADRFMDQYLLPLYPDNSRRERMYLIASDGELYGHHQPLRNKFLQWLTTGALVNRDIELTVPSIWLRDFPPEKSIRIRNNTSWSCHHGISRWASECACAEHGEWKAPIRRAFDRIANIVDTEMQKALDPYHLKLLEFRNEYSAVLTHRETAEAQLIRLTGKAVWKEAEKNKMLNFMNAQYERQRMYTSCGWFFGDFNRLESQNNILYAAKAIDYTEKATGLEFRRSISRYLSKIESHDTGLKASTIFNNAFKSCNPADS